MFAACGGILSSPNGVITSPNYPNDYNHNDACAWLISAPDGNQIKVCTITHFCNVLSQMDDLLNQKTTS